jgi:glycosyltransferase involved in cell wall biosynthesis
MKIFMSNLRGAPLYYPELTDVFGGSEVETFMLAKLFRRLGHDVTVLLKNRPKHSSDHVDGIQIKTLENRKGRQLRLFWQNMRVSKPDLCFIKLISEYSALMGTYCKLNGCGFIYRAANKRDLLLANREGNYSLLQKIYFKLTTSGSSLLLTQSKEQQHAFQRRFPTKPCFYEPNFQYPTMEQPLPFSHRKGVLWVGHLTPVKSPDRLIQLARLLPQTTFTVVAITSPTPYALGQEDKLRSLPNVDFRGQIPYSQMGALFSSAHVLLNTSLSEGFPNTFLQALFAGTPLASIDINPSRMLSESGAGLAISDHNMLATFLNDLCSSEEVWSTWHGQAIRESASISDISAAMDRYTGYLQSADTK